jgi:hypothetical protein
MKDIEILLRGFAMLIDGENYKPSMTKFLNKFSYLVKSFPDKNIQYLEQLFVSFLAKVSDVDSKLFHSKSGRFNISIYEAIFVATCRDAFTHKTLNLPDINIDKVEELKSDPGFIEAIQAKTASAKNVSYRIGKALELLN